MLLLTYQMKDIKIGKKRDKQDIFAECLQELKAVCFLRLLNNEQQRDEDI